MEKIIEITEVNNVNFGVKNKDFNGYCIETNIRKIYFVISNNQCCCEDCAREISHVLNVPMNIDIALDGTMSCPHCKNDLILAVDIGYFYNDTFCCEFCGQALRG